MKGTFVQWEKSHVCFTPKQILTQLVFLVNMLENNRAASVCVSEVMTWLADCDTFALQQWYRLTEKLSLIDEESLKKGMQ